MKALSLWQPWASLVAINAKVAETRHWAAPESLWGQRIAIHAAKRTSELDLCNTEPFLTVLGQRCLFSGDLPLGAIVATAVLHSCEPMETPLIEAVVDDAPLEIAFGHWQVGRYAWWLDDVERLPEPIPYTGHQGLFNVYGVLGQPAAPVKPAPSEPMPALFGTES